MVYRSTILFIMKKEKQCHCDYYNYIDPNYQLIINSYMDELIKSRKIFQLNYKNEYESNDFHENEHLNDFIQKAAFVGVFDLPTKLIQDDVEYISYEEINKYKDIKNKVEEEKYTKIYDNLINNLKCNLVINVEFSGTEVEMMKCVFGPDKTQKSGYNGFIIINWYFLEQLINHFYKQKEFGDLTKYEICHLISDYYHINMQPLYMDLISNFSEEFEKNKLYIIYNLK